MRSTSRYVLLLIAVHNLTSDLNAIVCGTRHADFSRTALSIGRLVTQSHLVNICSSSMSLQYHSAYSCKVALSFVFMIALLF